MQTLVTKLTLRSLALASVLVFVSPSSNAQTTFVDVTSQSNISYSGRSFGVSWSDINNDGLPDLWLGNHSQAPHLYLNMGGGAFSNIVPAYWTQAFKPSVDGHGAAIADYDNDGDQDILQSVGAESGTGMGPNLFLVQSPGVLSELAVQRNIAFPYGRTRTPQWVDWNNDGLLDVFLSAPSRNDGQGVSRLFIQQNGVFTERSGVSDVNGGLFSQLSDLGNNGTQYLVAHNHYSYPSKVYRVGDLPASDQSAALNIPKTDYVRDVAIADFNGDLLPDFYLARMDRSASEVKKTAQNKVAARLLLNAEQKEFSFTSQGNLEVAVGPGWELKAEDIRIGTRGASPGNAKSFWVSAADTSSQGLALHQPGTGKDLYIGYNPGTRRWTFQASSVHRLDANILIRSTHAISQLQTVNLGAAQVAKRDRLLINENNRFVPAANSGALAAYRACESLAAFDFDNDMDIDVYLVCRSQVGNEKNRLLINDGTGRFVEQTGAGGAAANSTGRGESVAAADFDQDGFVDLLVSNGNGEDPFTNGAKYQLFKNQGNSNNWLALELVGTQSNRDGIGAKVVLTAGGISQLREQNGGMHSYSQNYDQLHFGLASNSRAESIQVTWPDGSIQNVSDIAANQVLTVRQSDTNSNLDSDSDGLSDAEEQQLGTDPLNADSDGGGVGDGVEVGNGTDPLNSSDDIKRSSVACGVPPIDRFAHQGTFLWHTCDKLNTWELRTSGGGASRVISFKGGIQFDSAPPLAVPFELEPNDIVNRNTTNNTIKWNLRIWGNGLDGFSFQLPSGSACVRPEAPAQLPFYLGVDMEPLQQNGIDLKNGRSC